MKTAEEIFTEFKKRWGARLADVRIIEMINKYAEQFKPKWIPVGEEKLIPGKDYLVYIESTGIKREGHPDIDGRWWSGNIQIFGVTHHMDFPASPKKKPLPSIPTE